MNKEVITNKQMIILIIMFLAGTTALTVMGMDAKEDFWIASILSMLLAVPMIIIYCRLYYIFPGKNIFDIFEICFGKFIGKIIIIVYTYYLVGEATLVLLNYVYFVDVIFLTYTPLIVILISIMILCIWITKIGINVIGRWAELMVIIFMILIGVCILFAIPKMDINNIRPTLYSGINPILKGVFETYTFPFAQMTVFTMIFNNFKGKKSAYKVYSLGLLIGSLLSLLISTTSILILGAKTASKAVYPIYVAMSRIDAFNVIQGIDIIISTVFILGVFIKLSVYLIATSKGFATMFIFNDYRLFVIPTTLFMLILSSILFKGVLDYWEYSYEIWPYIAILFYTIIPIVTFIIAEIRNKIKTNY
ncbi:GerAB/ArcD/ProY family transporter [Abyssisolibacter fermentans]|uniref:GerAB/ArcD/ProY family transporter n=1 Tax=Abyssisolibacter fermentans TaxID=1766203 RepID=UPI0008338C5B|nr:endospore germination permease [Abyssisolibacter fermentans]